MIHYIEKEADLIAEGGEGRIYNYKNDMLIKIFKKDVNISEKMNKIQLLLHMNFPSSVISPLDLVFTRSKNPVGYLMKKVHGEELRMLASRKFVTTNGITKKDLLEILIKIRDTLVFLHSQNIFVGDLNDSNILFDSSNNVYFIDIDSWSIDQFPCTVVNDAFKDPYLSYTHFNAGTDMFAFAIICYKLLTRLHPFGGVYSVDTNMTLTDRIKKGISVINNSAITIPQMVDKNIFMPTSLIKDFESIFTSKIRLMLELQPFYTHLKLCPLHHDYFYSMYNKCPICEIDAKEIHSIVKLATENGIPFRVLFTDSSIKVIFDTNTYLDNNNFIRFRNSKQFIPYVKGNYYLTNNLGTHIYIINNEKIQVLNSKYEVFLEIRRKEKSVFKIIDDTIYYISLNSQLTQFCISDHGNYEKTIETVNINNVFEIYDKDTYFICNMYDDRKLISVSGYTFELKNKNRIEDFVIKYDQLTSSWLFIFETDQSNFATYIFSKTAIQYINTDIKYIGNIKNIDYNNGLIYKPKDGAIVRFNRITNESKEFKIDSIRTETKIIKNENKFIAIQEREINEIG